MLSSSSMLATCLAISAEYGLHCTFPYVYGCLTHMYSGRSFTKICSWSTGPNWPSNGEIDIIEGVNTESTNKMTMHTDPGCSINGNDCQGSQGCSVDAGPYGANINSAGGAVYALEWTSEGMKIWGWSGGSAPSDATGNNPDPSGWGTPTGNFPSGSGCNVDEFFKDQQLVFDTTFCGS